MALALRGLGSGEDGPSGVEGEGDGHHSSGSSPGSPPPELVSEPQPLASPASASPESITPSQEPAAVQQEHTEAMEECKEAALETTDTEGDAKEKEPSPLVINVSFDVSKLIVVS